MEKEQNQLGEELFNNLVDQYASMIRAICRKFYLIGGTSEDLYQEGMIGFLEAIKNFDTSRAEYGSEVFTKYAMTCVKRKVIDAIKHANAQKNMALNNSVPIVRTNSEDEEFEIGEIGAGDPEEIYLSHETADERIDLLIRILSDKERKVLSLYLEGMTSAQIAKELGTSARSVTNTIQRIKLKVKK